MSIFFYRTIFFVLLTLFSVQISAQQNTTAIKVTADKKSILIGEPVKITLEADIPENQPIRFFRFDSIPHFEFLSKEKIDTSDKSGGTILSQTIYITSFDSGHWVIPPFVLGDTLASDSIAVDVGFTPFDEKQPYHEIKDIIEVNPEEDKKEERQWWYVAAGVLLLVLIFVWVFRKKKKPAAAAIVIPVDPYKEALAQLNELQQHKPEAKQYYSRITDIFRNYVAERKGIHSLQQTTDDLMVQLRSLSLPKQQFDELAQYLRLSDFVKFAKYVPSSDDDDKIFLIVKKTIEDIEQIR